LLCIMVTLRAASDCSTPDVYQIYDIIDRQDDYG
jgi:hypothetical protein